MKTDKTIFTLAVLGSLVFVNIIAVKTFGRLDLTGDGQYTLGAATEDTLRRLTDPVTVKAYFSRDLPPPFSTNARYVQDILEEYYAHGGGYFRYEFVDPTEEETAEDKEKKKDMRRDIFGRAVREATTIEAELQQLGIPSVEVQVREQDKLELKRAYMGLAIKYGDGSEVIPVVRQTEKLEYDLTTAIRKLTRDKAPKIAIVTGDSSFDPQKEIGRIYGALTQLYDVSMLNLAETAEIGDDVDAIVVTGPKTPYSEAAQKAIDAFVMSGRSAAFLLDTVKPELSTLQAEEVDHGLGALLATYGVKIEKGLALDPECATITVQRQQGFMRIAQPVRYPFMPMAKSTNPDHPVTRGMAQIAFPFMSPLTITVPGGNGVKAEVLAKTSDQAWLEESPYVLDPFQRWTKDMVGNQKELNLLVTLSGSLKSHFTAPAAISSDEAGVATAADARVLVAGGSAFITDQFMSPGNQALVLNLIDWLLMDEGLLAMRSRGLSAAPVDDLGDGTRSLVKWGNILGLPILFIAFGLVRWRLREARRKQVMA